VADGSPELSEPDRIRTCDRLLRREVLYPAELRAHSRTNVLNVFEFFKLFVGVAGFEPATSASQTRRDNRATLHPEIGYLKNCGESGIRTHATVTRRQFSKLLH
jgi:hypothetical protein